MKRDMKSWLSCMMASDKKKALPILSFPSIQLMNITVKELISDSDMQAKGMHEVAKRTDAAASVSLMDLSVEAEAFGAEIRFSDDEVPAVVGALIEDENDAHYARMNAIDKQYASNVEKFFLHSSNIWIFLPP